jgi:hypothetical protein
MFHCTQNGSRVSGVMQAPSVTWSTGYFVALCFLYLPLSNILAVTTAAYA